jgi:hypothetical protein
VDLFERGRFRQVAHRAGLDRLEDSLAVFVVGQDDDFDGWVVPVDPLNQAAAVAQGGPHSPVELGAVAVRWSSIVLLAGRALCATNSRLAPTKLRCRYEIASLGRRHLTPQAATDLVRTTKVR